MISGDSDLILHNGRVLSYGARIPPASLVAIRGSLIRWVGEEDDLEMLLRPGTRVIDCEGGAIGPGFIDAHLHLFAFAANLIGVDCSPRAVSSIADIQSAIRRRAAGTAPGNWIRGWGMEEFHLSEKRLPRRHDLDQAAPLHPVRLVHRSGHASVLNSLGLAMAGLSEKTPEPPGGLMERDLRTGDLTGYLLEMEQELAFNQDSAWQPAEVAEGLTLAVKRLLAQGITSIHEATPTRALETWDTLLQRRDAGRLPIRVSKMVSPRDLAELRLRELTFQSGDDWLRIGAVKVFLNETGDRVLPAADELRDLVLKAHQSGFQVAFHAAEERGVMAALDAVAFAQKQRQKGGHEQSRRHRIEHCSVCPPDLAAGIAEARMLVVTQPAFVWEHGQRYLAQVPPDKQPWLYPLATLRRAGVRVAFGSDCPVVPPEPLVGVMAAATRAARDGQRLSKEQAIRARLALRLSTTDAAYASFEEGRKGRVSPGYLADLVVLSGDPLHTPAQRLADIKVTKTIVGGKVVWER